jgi:uncharacterized protein (DUF2235 family)
LRLICQKVFSTFLDSPRGECLSGALRVTGSRTHIFIADGTLSTLDEGTETNAGILYKLLKENGFLQSQTVAYHAGIQGRAFNKWLRAAVGLGINDTIREGYSALSSRYAEGDRIMLFGYSRGAYAVRSLAGLIDRIGLLKPEFATEDRVMKAFDFYESGRPTPRMIAFRRRYCIRDVPIELIGVWDTVKALGLPYPVLSWLAPMATEFHNDALGKHIRNGFHAIALDEDRQAFRPVRGRPAPDWPGRLEQVWFPGGHADVGGQVDGWPAARPLANIPLIWMLERAEECGLLLPEGWRSRFPADPAAPMVGARAGIGKLFLIRHPRRVTSANGEHLHRSVRQRINVLKDYAPAARGAGIG